MNEARSRDAALAFVVPLVLLFSSAGLPWYGRRSAFEEAGDRPGSAALVVLHFGMPLVAAAISLSRALRGREPRGPSFWLMTFQELLKAVAALLALVALGMRGRFDDERALALGGILLLLGLQGVALVRAWRREGWERWSHLLAAMVPWHVFVGVLFFLEQGRRHPLPGPWLYLLAVGALVPLYGWVLWPRRAAAGTPAAG